MLETDSEQWVRVLLQSSKASEALQVCHTIPMPHRPRTPRLAGRLPGSPAAHTCEPRRGQGFAASVEQMDARRREAAESVREQQAFIAVLQAALEREASQFCRRQ